MPRKPGSSAHQVVGRQDEHHVVVGAIEGGRRERDRRGRVAADGLGQEHVLAELRQLLADDAHVPAVGHDGDVPGGDELGHDPVPRPLQQRPIPDQGQERLGALRAGERPEAGASPAGEDDCVHREVVPSWCGMPALVRDGGPPAALTFGLDNWRRCGNVTTPDTHRPKEPRMTTDFTDTIPGTARQRAAWPRTT